MPLITKKIELPSSGDIIVRKKDWWKLKVYWIVPSEGCILVKEFPWDLPIKSFFPTITIQEYCDGFDIIK